LLDDGHRDLRPWPGAGRAAPAQERQGARPRRAARL